MTRRPRSLLVAVFLSLSSACSPPGGGTDGDADADLDADGEPGGDADLDSETDRPFSCVPGQRACHAGAFYECGPDGASRLNETPCPESCVPELGCVHCSPGSRRCEENVSRVCSAAGDRYLFGRDCTDWGSSCIVGTGFCGDACAEAETGESYVGCEYWPTPLANTAELDSRLFDFRVVVANPNTAAATVRVLQGTSEVASVTVAPGGLEEVVLPWSAASFGIAGERWSSTSTQNAAYRLISDLPVTASQFNPFDYHVTSGELSDFSYTNDATLLLPSHALTADYVALSYLPFSRRTGQVGMPGSANVGKFPNYIAVVGIAPEPTRVEVRLTGRAAGAAGLFGEAGPGETISFSVARGQVVHVTSAVQPDCVAGRPGYSREEECFGFPPLRICEFLDTCAEAEFDLTGSRVSADGPVAVFGGHVCAYVPYTSQACDHLEVQLPPIESWGTDFVSAPMADPGTGHANLVRVVAAFDGTEVSVSPPRGGVGAATLQAGEWVEFLADGPFHVNGSHAVMVGQFLLGQYFPEPHAARGDPAMTVLVPAEQYRADYTFVVPSSYGPATNGQNYVLIVRAAGLALELDGEPVVATWQSISGQEIGVVPLAGGTHHISSELPFGMIAFGLGSFTSYAYPAGLNLEQITPLI